MTVATARTIGGPYVEEGFPCCVCHRSSKLRFIANVGRHFEIAPCNVGGKSTHKWLKCQGNSVNDVRGCLVGSQYLISTALGSQDFTAQIISDGVSALSGKADVNYFNTAAVPLSGAPSSGAAVTGTFTTATNGRFPLAITFTPVTGQPTPELTNLNPACYIVDANTCLLLGLDATAPGTGILQLQNTGI